MISGRLRKGKRPEVVVELEGLLEGISVSFLADPRPELERFDIDAAMNALPADKRRKVEAICEELGISQDTRRGVLHVLCKLLAYQRAGSASVRTVKNDVDDLKIIADLARELAAKVEGLTESLKMILLVSCKELVHAQWPDEWKKRYEEGCGLVAPMVLLSDGADQARAAFEGNVNGGGRSPVLEHHGRHILDIWHAVEGTGLTPGRGKFLRLCNVIFDAAGIPSKADGAVRYFTENLLYVLPESVDATSRLLDRIAPQIADETLAKKPRKNPPKKSSQ